MTTNQAHNYLKAKWCIYVLSVSVLLLSSCGSLTPSLPSVPSIASSTPTATTTVGAISKDVESSLWQYTFICIVICFAFPSMRAPLVFFLKSVFGIISLPLDLAHKHITMLYNKKYNNEE